MEDEKAILRAVRKGAFAIRGLEVSPFAVPPPPVVLPVKHPSLISWQGSTGATSYTVEQAPDSAGPWHTVGEGIDETVTAYRPLFSDTTVETGASYYYRVIAHGPGGTSVPSAPEGPVTVSCRMFVDELMDSVPRFAGSKGTSFTGSKPWRFKYDFHRRKGKKGDFLEYEMNGPVTSIRIYAFFPRRATLFKVAISSDGKAYSPAVVRSEPYPYCCANPRDRLRLPVLFSAEPREKGNRVRIIFPGGNAQIGRCEIEYTPE
jgi:hypothetical protein